MKLHHITGVAALLLAATQVHAVPVTGSIGFTGGATFNTSSASTATQVTSWVSPQVTLDSGVFAVPSVFAITPGTAVAFAPGAWNFNTTTPINSFWSVGGFTFELLSSSVTSQGGTPGSSGYVAVSGTGIVSGNGYDPTSMSWSFTSQDPKAGVAPDSWTFSASGTTSGGTGVPDGGSTAMFLGAALSGLAFLKKKVA